MQKPISRTVRIIGGDCRKVLAQLPDKSVHCCVTSPPYFGLRDYGVAEQIGLEPTPDQYVAELVKVFREVRRVLRDDGTLWLNLGDSYAGSGKGGGNGHDKQSTNKGSLVKHNSGDTFGLKVKDLIGVPWMVAFALRADGWYLRQDIIWHKPNPMPESVTDRCTKAHEYIFLLSKKRSYYFDAAAIAELGTNVHPAGNKSHKHTTAYENGDDRARTKAGLLKTVGKVYETHNRRSVWTVTTSPTKEAHFATFPPKLIEPCILAGCPHGGTVLDPFAGSGVVGAVAYEHGRNAILIDLNPGYVQIAERRKRKHPDFLFEAVAK